MMKKNILFVLVMVALLSACSGGGDGSNANGTLTGEDTYTGNTSQAVITKDNVQILLGEAYEGYAINTSIAPLFNSVVTTATQHRAKVNILSLLYKSPQELILTISSRPHDRKNISDAVTTNPIQKQGECGGTYSGSITMDDQTGEFCGSITYDNYCSEGLWFSGKKDFNGKVDLYIGRTIILNISFNNYTVLSDGISLTINGSLTYKESSDKQNVIRFNTYMKDNSTGMIYWFNNYLISETIFNDYYEMKFAGRFYDPQYGFVDITTEKLLTIKEGDTNISDGTLLITGAIGLSGINTNAKRTFHSSTIYQEEADFNGDGSFEWNSGLLSEKDVAIVSPNHNVMITEGQIVYFQGSVNWGMPPYTYLWTFGGDIPDSKIEDPGHVTFTKAGIYTVNLSVTDNLGNQRNASTIVKVCPGRTIPWAMLGHDRQHTGYSPFIGPQEATLKWDFMAGLGIMGSPVIGTDGTVYVCAPGGKVYALDGTTGTVKWEFNTSGYIPGTPVVGVDGTVYVAGNGCLVYAIDGETGSQLWVTSVGNDLQGSVGNPIVGSDGTVYVGSSDHHVYALDWYNGNKIWAFRTESPVLNSPAIGADSTIYVASQDGNVYALDPVFSKKKWAVTIGGVFYCSPTVGPDGTVYVVGSYDKLYALNGVTGTQKWSWRGIFVDSGCSPAIKSDGTLYMMVNNSIYAIEGATGKVLWENYIPTISTCPSIPVVGTDDTIYVSTKDGEICALDRFLNMKWSLITGDQYPLPPSPRIAPNVGDSSPAISPNGIIYFCSTDGKVYAVGK